MPVDGIINEARWIPGRHFPQNEQALQHIDRVHERNERLVLRCHTSAGSELLLVMVGASVIGGITLKGVPRSSWTRPTPAVLALHRARGEEIGHFTFGSTVVVALPRQCGPLLPAVGDDLRMGQTLVA
jgi:phosphatidylserine decarboxylase